MAKFQKYLLLTLLAGLLVFGFILLRQQEISRCKNFFAEEKERREMSGSINFYPIGSQLGKLNNWCNWIVYGFR